MANKKLYKWGTAEEVTDYPVAAGVHIYADDIVVLDTTTGYARTRAAAALVATDKCVGVAYQEADNTGGAAGAITVACQRGINVEFPQSATNPLLVTDTQAYVEDMDYPCCFRTAAPAINVPLGEVKKRTATTVIIRVCEISKHDALKRIEALEGY
jgi:MinD-like ATPase involved in chromosome partitioning or flagellar assembly